MMVVVVNDCKNTFMENNYFDYRKRSCSASSSVDNVIEVEMMNNVISCSCRLLLCSKMNKAKG